jgi:hypothetical protein
LLARRGKSVSPSMAVRDRSSLLRTRRKNHVIRRGRKLAHHHYNLDEGMMVSLVDENEVERVAFRKFRQGRGLDRDTYTWDWS